MAQPEAKSEQSPLKKLDQAAIAPRHARHWRAAAFQTYVLFSSALFATLAVVAHTVAYFPIDLRITQAVQAYHGETFAHLMYAISWLGFMPQAIVIGLGVIMALALLGLRWEAVGCAVAQCAVGIGTLVKLVVVRPRPSADLVHVFAQLSSSGFPSGHVLEYTGLAGFLGFLCFTLFRLSWGRTVVMLAFGVLILLMGLSRIYQGQHWFSDVMGAYLLGTLWLALTIKFYRWGKTKFFVRQPVAPEAPSAAAAQGAA